jgi:hypothetical protein
MGYPRKSTMIFLVGHFGWKIGNIFRELTSLPGKTTT